VVWSINLHPQEFLRASKTGYFDETITLDDPQSCSCLSLYFEVLRQNGEDEPLWPFTHEELVKQYHAATTALKFKDLETSLYGLRHGGASADFLLCRRALSDIKFRGRWTSDSSLRRHQKSAVAQREVFKLSAAARSAARAIESDFSKILDSPTRARQLIAELIA
jgi:hypothetical protein